MAGCSSNIGVPQTAMYAFGAAEIRIGGLGEANKLTQQHSMGVLSDASFEYTREFAELRGGSGNPVLAKGVSSSDAKISGTFSEQTYRNLMAAVGGGVGADAVVFSTTATAAQVAGDTTISVASTGAAPNVIAAGSILSIHNPSRPEDIQVVKVASVAGQALTLETQTPLLYDVNPLDVVVVRNPVSDSSCGEQYITVELIAEAIGTKAPSIVKGWYGSFTSGLSTSQNTQNFSETNFEISLYPIPLSLTAPGAVMEHISPVIDLQGRTFMLLPEA